MTDKLLLEKFPWQQASLGALGVVNCSTDLSGHEWSSWQDIARERERKTEKVRERETKTEKERERERKREKERERERKRIGTVETQQQHYQISAEKALTIEQGMEINRLMSNMNWTNMSNINKEWKATWLMSDMSNRLMKEQMMASKMPSTQQAQFLRIF